MSLLQRYLFLSSILFTLAFMLICIAQTQPNFTKTSKNQITDQLNPIIHFSDDYTDQQRNLILAILQESQLIELQVFGKLYLAKTTDSQVNGLSSGAGIIWINQEILKNLDKTKLKRVLGHELGHIFDYFAMDDLSRIEYAKLRGIGDIENVQKEWFLDNLISLESTENPNWAKAPVEDFAEVFAFNFFNQEGEIKTNFTKDISQEVKSFLFARLNKMNQYSLLGQTKNMTANAVYKWQELVPGSANLAKIITLPQTYGPLMYMFKRQNIAGGEYVFTSINRENRNLQINYSYNPAGYDKYDSYFQKAADEILFYNKKNYYLLIKQGENQDFILMADGEMVLMTNDPDLTKYDLMSMILNSQEMTNL